MAEHLGLKPGEFMRRYLTKDAYGNYHLGSPDKPCQFLDGKRCSAYEGRPSQCRSWPFWPENMKAKTWNEEIAPNCPGVGKGRLHSADEIRAILSEDP